jgi:hypothetical protein
MDGHEVLLLLIDGRPVSMSAGAPRVVLLLRAVRSAADDVADCRAGRSNREPYCVRGRPMVIRVQESPARASG